MSENIWWGKTVECDGLFNSQNYVVPRAPLIDGSVPIRDKALKHQSDAAGHRAALKSNRWQQQQVATIMNSYIIGRPDAIAFCCPC